MNTNSEKIDHHRRHLLGAAAVTAAAAQLGLLASANAQSADGNAALDQAGDERLVRSAEADQRRPSERRIRRSGSGQWPAGHSSARLALRHSQLCRRDTDAGVGGLPCAGALPARLRGNALSVQRNLPQRSALGAGGRCHRLHGCAQDREGNLAGFDWGARSADIVAALWPERVKALVAVSGYLIGSQEAGRMPLPPKAELEWWYQFYFATDRGRIGYEKYRREFSKLIWQIASPEVEVRRRDVRTQRGGLRQSGPRRHRHPQLSLAAWPGRRRAEI